MSDRPTFGVLEKTASAFRDWRETTLSPLRVPLFLALWIGALLANFGVVLQTVAASWEMATLTTSAQLVALVQTASLGPFMPLALPAGAIADNYDRRTVMLMAQMVCFLGAATLAATSFLGLSSPWLLLTLTAVIGAAVSFHQPAWQASFADLVPRAILPATVALSALTFNVARSVGPAIGGAVTAFLGSAATFLLTTFSFTGLIIALSCTRFAPAPSPLPRESIPAAMVAGWRFARLSRPVQIVLARIFVFAFGGSAVAALAPLVAQERLGGDAVTYGLLLSAFGVGALCAALGVTYLRALLGAERMTLAAIVAFAFGTLGIGLSTNTPISLACNVAAGMAWTLIFTTSTTCIQLNAPRWVMGRAIAMYQVASLGALALGSAFWGAVAHRLDLVTAFVGAAIFVALNVIVMRLAPLPTGGDDLAPYATGDVPAPQVSLTDLEGPIVTTIEYRVHPEDLATFLVLMSELGRARQRDGARGWALQQDIDQPEIWIERIESQSWNEVLRRIGRGTVSDETLRARAAAFRNGANAVRRMVKRTPRG